MLKLILKDYRANSRPAFVKQIKSGGWFGLVYFFYFPFSGAYDHSLFRHNAYSIPLYYCEVFVLVLLITIASMYPNKLSKMLFLCPTTRKDRRRYLWSAFILRSTIPILVSGLLTGILLVTNQNSFFLILILFFVTVFMSLVSNLRLEGSDKTKHQEVNERIIGKKELKGYNAWMAVAGVAGVLNYIGCLGLFDLDFSNTWEKNILLISLMIQGVSSVYVLCRYYNPVMQIAQDYELTYLAIEDNQKSEVVKKDIWNYNYITEKEEENAETRPGRL